MGPEGSGMTWSPRRRQRTNGGAPSAVIDSNVQAGGADTQRSTVNSSAQGEVDLEPSNAHARRR
jgi:hypothetical protein